MSDFAVKIDNLSKIYKLYREPMDRLKEALHPFRKKYHRDFYALRDVSFEIGRGETFGIIGKNGAGKSTLLKILTGVLTQTSGDIVVNGRVSSILELGSGFNPDLTGIENIYFNGAILGFGREDIDSRLDEILNFADIGDFAYQPMKMYSSGMQLRLAFALAISVDPDIFIVDEALAVGDIRFQQKCLRKFHEFQEMGKTIIFVTHDMGLVTNYCQRVLWLNDGKIEMIGDSEEVAKKYVYSMYYGVESQKNVAGISDGCVESNGNKINLNDIILDSVEACEFFGQGGARIEKVALYSAETGEKLDIVRGGEQADFYMQFAVVENIENPIVGFVVKDEKGNAIFGMNSHVIGTKLQRFVAGDVLMVDFKFKFPSLRNGVYTFSPAVADGTQDNHIQLHWVHDGYVVQVANENESALMGWYFVIEDSNISISNL